MIKKITIILIKILLVLLICQTINIPKSRAEGFLGGVIDDANNFIQNGENSTNQNSVTDDGKLKETSNKIYNVLLAIGIVLSVIIGGILGIQIMWGSIEQQVKAKEMLMPYAAGCVVIFGAFGIWKICVTIFSQLQ